MELSQYQKYLILRIFPFVPNSLENSYNEGTIVLEDVSFKELNSNIEWTVYINGQLMEIISDKRDILLKDENVILGEVPHRYGSSHQMSTNKLVQLATGNFLRFPGKYPDWEGVMEDENVTMIQHFDFRNNNKNIHTITFTEVCVHTLTCLQENTWGRNEPVVLSVFSPLIVFKKHCSFVFAADKLSSVCYEDREILLFRHQNKYCSAILNRLDSESFTVNLTDGINQFYDFSIKIDRIQKECVVDGTYNTKRFCYQISYSDEDMHLVNSDMDMYYYYYYKVDSFAALLSE